MEKRITYCAVMVGGNRGQRLLLLLLQLNLSNKNLQNFRLPHSLNEDINPFHLAWKLIPFLVLLDTNGRRRWYKVMVKRKKMLPVENFAEIRDYCYYYCYSHCFGYACPFVLDVMKN